jgi:hypothetical protein
MNHLVSLNAQAGELEKILSGVKTMLVKEFDPAQTTMHPVNPGDSLYFLRDKDDCAMRVKATVVRVLLLTNRLDQDLSHTLKEMQPRLQLTEDQYNHWLTVKPDLLVEFDAARKIAVINLKPEKFKDRSSWIAVEEFSLIQELGGINERCNHDQPTYPPFQGDGCSGQPFA